MSASETESKTLTVQELAAFNDDELAAFMKKHRSTNGNLNLPVDGWDKLSQDERSSLAQRLIAQEQVLAQDPAVNNGSLDLNKLDELLLEAAHDNKDSFSFKQRQSVERSRSPTVFPDEEGDAKEDATEAYNELISEGGRPLYPMESFLEVTRNPEAHAEMLRPWSELGDPKSYRVFYRQRERWLDFRKWQRDNRGLEDDDGGYEGYVEWKKGIMKRYWSEKSYAKWLADLEADPALLKSDWEFKQQRRERQRYYNRERGCDGFSEYAEAVRQRLARHDFTQSFQLKPDPKEQDKVTTWIEYLSFEYWWLDKHDRHISRLTPVRDEAWQELVDTGLFMPHETEEYLRSDESAMADESAKDQAAEAKRMAFAEGQRVYNLTQVDPDRLSIPEEERRKMLQEATANVNAAKDRWEKLRDREQVLYTFFDKASGLEHAKQNIALQRKLMPWVLEQLPLVEAEQSGTDGVVSTPSTERKRKLSTDGDTQEMEKSKRQKQGHEDPVHVSESSATTSAAKDEKIPVEGPKPTKPPLAVSEAHSKATSSSNPGELQHTDDPEQTTVESESAQPSEGSEESDERGSGEEAPVASAKGIETDRQEK